MKLVKFTAFLLGLVGVILLFTEPDAVSLEQAHNIFSVTKIGSLVCIAFAAFFGLFAKILEK